MVKKAQRAKGGSARAWALIALHDPSKETLGRLRRVEDVVRAERVWRSFKARPRTNEVTAIAEIHAKDHDALLGRLRYLEAHFSHVEAYEF